MISELFYDPFYLEWWRDSGGYYDEAYECGGDNCDGELQNFSDTVITREEIFPVFFDFGFVYAFNSHFRLAIHFQQPIIGVYWKF